MRVISIITTALSVAALSSTTASAQGQNAANDRTTQVLEEIVVTAEKRSERIQQLPVAISAFSEEALTSRGIQEMDSLPRLVPGLTMQTKNGSFTNPGLRGITARESSPTVEAPLVISQDGVPYASSLLAGVDFFDVERVEVLRGPQGTISGRNATAGAINVLSKRPTEVLEGGAKATVGNYSRWGVEGYLSGPIASDRLLGRLAFQSDQADGWVTNALSGQELGDRDKLQARASFLAPVSEQFEAQLILDGTRDRSRTLVVDDGRVRPDVQSLTEFLGAPAFDRDRGTVSQDIRATTEYDRYQGTLRLVWNLGAATITATSGYVDLSMDATTDVDSTLPALVWTKPLLFDVEHLSQEVTLTADLSERSDLILGALYLQQDITQTMGSGLPLIGIPPGAIDQRVEDELTSWAGYMQWRYRLTDELRLTAGARYTHDTKDHAERSAVFGMPIAQDADASWDAWTPRIALDYTPSEDVLLYVSAARGFNSGGFAGDLITPVYEFDPEYVWNYEVGLKTSALQRRLSSAVTAFYMDYQNLQQTVAGITPGPFSARVVNANAATIKGVELELSALITDQLQVTATGTWLDAKYDELSSFDSLYPELGTPGPAGVNVRNLAGNQLVRAPQWAFNLGGQYTLPLGSSLEGILRASYAWQDKVYFDFFNHEGLSQDAYGLVDLSVTLQTIDARWEVTAFVNNLTDEYYRPFEQGASLAPGTQSSVVLPGWPRTYGASVAYRF